MKWIDDNNDDKNNLYNNNSNKKNIEKELAVLNDLPRFIKQELLDANVKKNYILYILYVIIK